MNPIKDLTPKHFFFDLEVDSVPKNQGEPLPCIKQICVCDPSRAKGFRYFVANVIPHKLLRRGEVNTNYNPQEHQVKEFKWKKVFTDLKKWVDSSLDGNRKAVLIAHNNYKHDWPILERECARVQMAVPTYWRPFCTAYLAGALYGRGGNSLSMLCGTLGVQKLPAHDAYNDVKMLKNVFKRMRGKANLKKIVQAMLTPPKLGPVKKVAAIIRENLTPNVVVYDFEATGLIKKNQLNPRVVEVGAFFPNSNEEWQTFVNPGIKIPEESIKIHHITDKMVEGAPKFKAAWLQLEEKIDNETANTANRITILMGHNIWGYDEKVRKMECERTNLPYRNFKSFDTYALCNSLFKGLPRISQKLQTWVERLNIPIKEGEAHRAGADSRVNYEFFSRLIDGVPKKIVNKSLMSAHPVKSLACAILERGTFKPSFWSPKKGNNTQIKRKKEKPQSYNRESKKTKVKEEKTDFSVYAPVKKKATLNDYFFNGHTSNNPIIIDDEDDSWNRNAPLKKSYKREREDTTEPVVKDIKREKPESQESSKEDFSMFFPSK